MCIQWWRWEGKNVPGEGGKMGKGSRGTECVQACEGDQAAMVREVGGRTCGGAAAQVDVTWRSARSGGGGSACPSQLPCSPGLVVCLGALFSMEVA